MLSGFFEQNRALSFREKMKSRHKIKEIDVEVTWFQQDGVYIPLIFHYSYILTELESNLTGKCLREILTQVV